MAVSQVLATVLLLVMSVSSFSTLYFTFLTTDILPSSPSSNIVGTIQNNSLILEHRGGDYLSLETEVILETNNRSREYFLIKDNDFMLNSSKDNNRWNLGEKVTFSLQNLTDFKRFDTLDVSVIDKNFIVMNGRVHEARVSDIEIFIEIDEEDLNPLLNDFIDFVIIVKNNGPSPAEELKIKISTPFGMLYSNHSASNGIYNNSNGIWEIGYLEYGESVSLQLEFKVIIIENYEFTFTQLALILDGSGSISGNDWNLMLDGLADSVDNGDIPNIDLVELTVVQFGGGWNEIEPQARLEIGPVVLTNHSGEPGYYLNVANSIRSMQQLEGYTPMSAGFKLTEETLLNSSSFSNENRQVINLVTDGMPNCIVTSGYESEYVHDNYASGKIDAKIYRNQLISNLGLTDDQDEIDIEAVEGVYGQDIEWLRDNIAYPSPGYDNWPPKGSGWVRQISSYEEFRNTISSQFNFIFNGRTNVVELIGTKYMDPNSINNIAEVTILPR